MNFGDFKLNAKNLGPLGIYKLVFNYYGKNTFIFVINSIYQIKFNKKWCEWTHYWE